jgi:hypothetical protein
LNIKNKGDQSPAEGELIGTVITTTDFPYNPRKECYIWSVVKKVVDLACGM